MRKKAPLQEVDPLALPLGTRVGPWLVTGFRGRGAYGTLYRAEREGREAEGPAALKLAVHPGDERFKREAWLLRHVHSLYVPRFKDEGEWEHPSGIYPYVVMELVEGEPLYEFPQAGEEEALQRSPEMTHPCSRKEDQREITTSALDP